MRPANFLKYLNELGFSEQVSSLLSELWSVHAKSIIDTLKKEPCSLLKVFYFYVWNAKLAKTFLA
jgi:hypothetical protein